MSKGRMHSGASNECETRPDDRFGKVRRAAAVAIRELGIVRSAGPVTQEALEAEVSRIARETLHPLGYDLVVRRMDDGITRFLIKVRNTGRTYDLINSFFHRDDGPISAAEV
jgi:hypothetical protein